MVIRRDKNKNLNLSKRVVLQQNAVKYCIKQAQAHMLGLVNNLGSFEPFDNSVVPGDCVDRLVAHRIKSKFHVENPTLSNELQTAAFAKYIDYDSTLSTSVDLWKSYDLRKARELLHKWFKGFSFDVASAKYEVSPGETYISSGGEVSILSKLFHKDHWTTTANCLHDTCVFIYNNASFKRAANHHIANSAVTRLERRKLFMRFRHKADVGFHVFKDLLTRYVLTIVDGARASSVPKSNDQRRFINIEAMFSVIIQRVIASGFLRVLKRVGNDMGNFRIKLTSDATGFSDIEHSAQRLHGLMIKSNLFSTIDFSNASDSVTVAAVVALFPRAISDLLLRARSHYVEIDGVLHEPNKLSSMGNGFTFEVMTMMLYSIASVMTPYCRVYGDDVILPNEYAYRFLEACLLINFRINEKKTFINSFFRESCGYFYSDHINDYILSFDFNQIKSFSDIVITCNKLTVIIEKGQVGPELLEKLIVTRDQIASLVHASRKGPLPVSERMQRKYLAMYIFDSGYVKKQRRSKELRTLRQHFIEKNEQHFVDCQLEYADYALVYIPFFVPDRSNHVFTGTKGMDVLLPALYSGKRLRAAQKGKGKWRDLPAFVHFDGTVTLISNLIKPHNVWVDRLSNVICAHEKV